MLDRTNITFLDCQKKICWRSTMADIVITQEPDNDPSPLASWSNSVAETWLIPPFGQ